ncbi:MAG: class I SAM-dependent methyltransferase [Geminicoccaceae bacterium]
MRRPFEDAGTVEFWAQGAQTDDWVRSHWGNAGANAHFLKQTGLLNEPKRVLEIGCGKGNLLRDLHARGHQVVGLDLSEKALRVCDPDVPRVAGRGDALPFKTGAFDIVVSFDVFEHIPNSDVHLQEVARVLTRSGHYLLQTPNKWTNVPFEMLRWSRRFGLKHMFDFLKPPEHCALHSYWQLRRRLRKNGFVEHFDHVPVVNDFFKAKLSAFAGRFGLMAIKIINPDELPMSLRTNFYVRAQRTQI